MPKPLPNRVAIPPDVLLQEVQGESVLLNLNTGQYFGLNGMGTRMWQECTTAVSLQAALDRLVAEYDVDPQRVEQDLQNLVEQLVSHGLLSVAD